MAITQLTRYKGGKGDEVVNLARQAKAIWERLGAELFLLNRFHTGPFVGEWLVVTRFSDWAAYGTAHQAASEDEEFQELLAQVLSIADMTGRTVLVGVDL